MPRILACLLLCLSVVPAFARSDPYIDLEDWDRRPIAAGLEVRRVLGHPVLDAGNRVIGTASDVLFDVHSRARALVVRSAGDRVVAYDWSRIRVGPGAQSASVAGAGGPDNISLPARTDAARPRPFYASELLGDRAQSDSMRSFGIVRDVVVTPSGQLGAIVVQLFHIGRMAAPSGSFPFPFYGYALTFDPASGYYPMPYNEEFLYRYAVRYMPVRPEG